MTNLYGLGTVGKDTRYLLIKTATEQSDESDRRLANKARHCGAALLRIGMTDTRPHTECVQVERNSYIDSSSYMYFYALT